MKAKAKRDIYPVPEIGQWVRATYEEGSREHMTNGYMMALNFMEWHEMERLKSQNEEPLLGMPVRIAHNSITKEVMLYPAPEKDGELYLGFFPPMIEI